MLGISGAKGLASAIRKYLKTNMIFKKLTVAKKHMDIIAESIVQAIGAGTPL
jgi:23S rRNA pseudoU1915 N3-methylase RlmH